MEKWNIQKSLSLYNVNEWSRGFFNINAQGNACVTPRGKDGPTLDLNHLVQDLRDRGFRLPIWIRFPDIVSSRIQSMSNCFQNAFKTYNYKGNYRGVYPIKVNQQSSLLEDILSFGAQTNLGLEAGSKPELLVALAYLENPKALLICNGFKDREYIETALLATRIGRNVIIVVDRFHELELIIEESKKLGIQPKIGFRAKLEGKGSGKWSKSSGTHSKFGLTNMEIVEGIELLEKEGLLHTLKLLHFHLGSQVTSIRPIKVALDEACRIYAEVCAMGAKLSFLDVGGGLAVDYDGSKTNSENSLNYSDQEYANDVVSTIQNICDEKDLPHPGIVTESGRSLVAHHCVMIFDVLGENKIVKSGPIPTPEKEDHDIVRDMHDTLTKTNAKNKVESYHDALQIKEESFNLFRLGYLNLKTRAKVEKIFWQAISKIRRLAHETEMELPEELESIDSMLQNSYFCNFSVFQSAPDHWAVKQLFPVLPIHRLNTEPTNRVSLMDLTCDSDGQMDHFIDIKDVKRTLEVHNLEPKKDYYLGIFLLGAYQEILGDMHNLFGDTDSVHVSIKGDDDYTIEHYRQGDSVTRVLEYVDYKKPILMERMRLAVEQALRGKTISIQEGRKLLKHYEEGLEGYTYLESDD